MDRGSAQPQEKDFTALQMINWTQEINKKAKSRKGHSFMAWALRKQSIKRRNMRKIFNFKLSMRHFNLY